MFNNTVVAVCGHYVCDYYGYLVHSGETYTQLTLCNNKVECYNSGVDEKYCTEKEEEVFKCRNSFDEIPISRVCDRKCDCKSFCDDESNCGNLTTCVLEGESIRPYILANYSRCTPEVVCANKLDQTNCSDTTLAPLQCPVHGYMSTVSRLIICQPKVYSHHDNVHSNSSAVCDDGIDVRCVTPTSKCYIHKHQLCDRGTDCRDGSDERRALCTRFTAQTCKRKYNYKKSLRLPISWIDDGVEDCVGGMDEDIRKWKSCIYSTFTIYGSEECEDVYICPSGYPLYVEIPSLCDEMLSCEGGNVICETAALASPQVRYTPMKVENVNHLHICLLGLQGLKTHFEGCEQATYPNVDILGTKPNNLSLPVKQVSCKYMYGEQYVYMSCSGKCYDANCPLTSSEISGSTCPNIIKRRTYSISADGNLVIVQKVKNDFKVKNLFICRNDNCIPYSNVCNLIDDCGDGTDEDSCHNHFTCNTRTNFTKSYIPLSSVCDGKYDCLDSSDEISCCHRKLINDLTLKISAWVIRILALLLNGIIQVRSLWTLKVARTSSALTDKVLITLISFGDWLVGCYLFVLAVTDNNYGSNFCSQQIEWLLSSYCSILGVVSTFGSQNSLFSMTILSVTRVFRITKGLSIPGPVSKKSYALVSFIIFLNAGASFTIAIIPTIPHFEDIFVNALYFSNINFLRGFATKEGLKPTLELYYGRIRLGVFNLSWNSVRSLINDMFTKIYGGVSHRILDFYGNDPVCLFKFFVSSDDPQSAYSWSLLATNFVCFAVISISYLIVFVITSASSLSRSQGITGDMVRSRNNRLQRKISIIILTDFLCWVPFVIICFLHTIGRMDASPWYAMLSILILPVNSVINPLLYDDTLGRIVGRVSRWIWRVVNMRGIAQRLCMFRGHREAFIRTDVAREQKHTPLPLQPDGIQKPGHTTPVLPEVAKEPGHTALIVPDVAREPGYTTPVLPGVAREPGHTPTVQRCVAREPGHTPTVQPDVAKEPGHTPLIKPDVHREPGHTPPIQPDIAREPGHTPPVPPNVAEESGHTPPVLPDAAREPGHIISSMSTNVAETLV